MFWIRPIDGYKGFFGNFWLTVLGLIAGGLSNFSVALLPEDVVNCMRIIYLVCIVM